MNQGHNPALFTILASEERRPRMPALHLKYVPNRGKLRPVEIKPTRATPHLGAHANERITVTQHSNQDHAIIVWNPTCHVCDDTLHAPCIKPPSAPLPNVPLGNKSRVSQRLVPHTMIPMHDVKLFCKRKAFLFYLKTHWIWSSHENVLFKSNAQIPCVMHLWAMDFRVSIAGQHTPFHHFYGLSPSVIMSNRN